METISTNAAPAPGGHYVQATVAGELVFVSGQLPLAPGGARMEDESFEAQARRALENVLAILEAAGSSPDRVLKVTAYIVSIEHWSTFNQVFAQVFGGHRPARSVVPVPELHYGFLVEIDAIAARSSTRAPER